MQHKWHAAPGRIGMQKRRRVRRGVGSPGKNYLLSFVRWEAKKGVPDGSPQGQENRNIGGEKHRVLFGLHVGSDSVCVRRRGSSTEHEKKRWDARLTKLVNRIVLQRNQYSSDRADRRSRKSWAASGKGGEGEKQERIKRGNVLIKLQPESGTRHKMQLTCNQDIVNICCADNRSARCKTHYKEDLAREIGGIYCRPEREGGRGPLKGC